MHRLIKYQLHYFWDMNHRRLISLHLLFLLLVVGAFRQTAGNPRLTVMKYLLGGTVAGEAVNHIIFPVGWFITLLIPGLGIGDAIPQLWKTQGIQIWGKGYSRRQFALVDSLLTAAAAVEYWLIICIIIRVVAPTRKLSFLVELLPNIILIELVGMWASWFNRFAGIFVIMAWLTVTIYTSFTFNPLSYTMQMRELPLSLTSVVGVIISPVIVASLYVGCLPMSLKDGSEYT